MSDPELTKAADRELARITRRLENAILSEASASHSSGLHPSGDAVDVDEISTAWAAISSAVATSSGGGDSKRSWLRPSRLLGAIAVALVAIFVIEATRSDPRMSGLERAFVSAAAIAVAYFGCWAIATIGGHRWRLIGGNLLSLPILLVRGLGRLVEKLRRDGGSGAKGRTANLAGQGEPGEGSASAASPGGHGVMADMWQWIGDHREPFSNIVIAVIVAVLGIAAWVLGPAVAPSHATAPRSCLKLGHATGHKTRSRPVQVRNATDTLTIYVGRDGNEVRRETNALAIQNDGRLGGGTVLCTIASDFVRSDGLILPANQVMSQAVVSNNGLSVTIRVQVAPRAGQVSGFGSYSGMVRLDDSRASGAEVPVRIYVEYPFINRVLLCGLLLASAGLIWGLLVRIADADVTANGTKEPFFANLALRVAVLATAVPIINAQVLSDPGWTGTLSQYIKLGGLVGAAAIAATPSLRAIVSRMHPNKSDS